MTSREEIVDYALKSRLLRTCVECQIAKSKGNAEFLNDLEQDMWLWMMTYDLEKLQDAYENNHLNALISKVLINQIYSNTSPFYKTYKKFACNSDEITYKELNIPDE